MFAFSVIYTNFSFFFYQKDKLRTQTLRFFGMFYSSDFVVLFYFCTDVFKCFCTDMFCCAHVLSAVLYSDSVQNYEHKLSTFFFEI